MFFCETCRVEYKTKRSFYIHINSKQHIEKLKQKTIQPADITEQLDESHKCKYCNTDYKYKTGLSNHLKKCITYTTLIEYGKGLDLDKAGSIDLFTKLKHDKELVKSILSSKVRTPIENMNTNNITQNTTTNNVTNSHNITNNLTNSQNTINNTTNNLVMIMPFGQEDLSMITDDIQKQIITSGHCAFEKLLLLISTTNEPTF